MLVGLLTFAACSSDDDDDGPDCDITNVTYDNSIESMISASGCTESGCHNSGSMNGSLASYDDAVFFVGFGRILGALRHESGFSPMPKVGDKWDDCMVDKLEAWINDGTPR